MTHALRLLAAITAFAIISFTSSPKLTVTSTAFSGNGLMPSRFSCEGKEVSPPLHIGNVPAKAKTLAIIMHDPDAPLAGGFTHWVIWNISTNGDLTEDFKEADQGINGMGKAGYKGMCPPSGTHHYHFKVYALDMRLDLDKSTDKAALEKAMTGHILAQGEMVGLYKKTK